MWQRILQEPTLVMAVVRQAILWAVAMYWLKLDEQQIAMTMAFVETITALINRALVTSNVKAEQLIERTATTGIAQSLKSAVVILLVAGTLAGCSTSQRGTLFRADRTIHASLSSVQDASNALCDAEVIPAQSCQAFNKALVPALQAGDDFNRAVRAERVGAYGELLEAIGRLTSAINQYIPEAQRAQLLKLLGIEGVN